MRRFIFRIILLFTLRQLSSPIDMKTKTGNFFLEIDQSFNKIETWSVLVFL